MRITVIGGSGRTGRLIVEQLLSNKHAVVATIRSTRHMADLVKLGAEVQLVDLDKSEFDVIVNAMKGSDAVIFAAGSAAGETSELDRKGTLRTVRAAEKAGVPRYVSISSIGASTGLSTRSMDEEMKDYYRQKRAAAKHITGSSLKWTIIEPGQLTDEPGTGKVTMTEEALDIGPIPRADVAAVTVAVVEEPRTAGHVYQVIGGQTAIDTALEALLGK
ncbi:SDR family oxidoreductase [Devosia sp. ZB163]|uniref:NAD(P)-binding oxidoreductase n=1 Tax=Devosia sp. ZB163 TaxID=3025938 RepID=UPI00235FD2E1|nr:NAD(P)-binding oxidoreductase [Devosia sp. ZB163]MDC9822377.1 SDR family oxidoreductase [Devosia sp. ZB163]